jgi:hypothetical protein
MRVFANWKDAEIYLSFDTSMLWGEYCIIRLCVVHLGRGIPMGWRVIKHKSSSVNIDTYQDLLQRVSRLLPVNVKVILLADRGFGKLLTSGLIRLLSVNQRAMFSEFSVYPFYKHLYPSILSDTFNPVISGS